MPRDLRIKAFTTAYCQPYDEDGTQGCLMINLFVMSNGRPSLTFDILLDSDSQDQIKCINLGQAQKALTEYGNKILSARAANLSSRPSFVKNKERGSSSDQLQRK